MPLEGITVSLGPISGTWHPDTNEREAAWEMYVELVTRAAIQPLPAEEGILREALTSLHELFGITRRILREHGPVVAQPKDGGDLSFGAIALAVLNGELRPVLTKWHPLLSDHESAREPQASVVEHEMRWDKNEELRGALDDTRRHLIRYAELLAQVAGVPELSAAEVQSPSTGERRIARGAQR